MCLYTYARTHARKGMHTISKKIIAHSEVSGVIMQTFCLNSKRLELILVILNPHAPSYSQSALSSNFYPLWNYCCGCPHSRKGLFTATAAIWWCCSKWQFHVSHKKKAWPSQFHPKPYRNSENPVTVDMECSPVQSRSHWLSHSQECYIRYIIFLIVPASLCSSFPPSLLIFVFTTTSRTRLEVTYPHF
jgi:hypothetical protein